MQDDWRVWFFLRCVHREQEGSWWVVYVYFCNNLNLKVGFEEEEVSMHLRLLLATGVSAQMRSDWLVWCRLWCMDNEQVNRWRAVPV